MSRVIATIAASMLSLCLQASIPAEGGATEDTAVDSQVYSGTFRARFQRLQLELRRHRALEASGGWPTVPDGPTIRPAAEDPRLGVLARRLVASGDFPGTEPARPYYDDSLQDAVRRFQSRHGLAVDGLVGKATLRALNAPIERRIGQIRVNLERMRPLSDVDVDDFLLVNVPAFTASLIQGRNTVWTTKVIVGEKEDQTPELRSELRSIVFNPTWSVPYSIASEELLPQIRDDPDFFTNGRYQLHDRDGNRIDPSSVDWGLYSSRNFPFRLQQQPGPANQLGRIKFMIPNPYSVCVHDTPSRSLFANANLALSHGCIRMENPLDFAERILDGEGWTRAQIDAQIDSGDTRTIALSEPLAVYVLYWTAEVGDPGRIHFYEDIYGLDAKILEMLDRSVRSDHDDQPADRQ